MDVVTFEVKTHENCDLTAVYEALAHLRAATRSYVIVVVPVEEAAALAKLLEDMEDEAVRHGIGFIVVSDVKNYDTWEFKVDSQPHTPDPAKLDEFIERQLSEENKKKLRKWIK